MMMITNLEIFQEFCLSSIILVFFLLLNVNICHAFPAKESIDLIEGKSNHLRNYLEPYKLSLDFYCAQRSGNISEDSHYCKIPYKRNSNEREGYYVAIHWNADKEEDKDNEDKSKKDKDKTDKENKSETQDALFEELVNYNSDTFDQIFSDTNRAQNLANLNILAGNWTYTSLPEYRLDLSGGYYDAGDYMKFSLPLLHTLTVLSWSAYQYEEEYKELGIFNSTLSQIKWGIDYVVKSVVKQKKQKSPQAKSDSNNSSKYRYKAKKLMEDEKEKVEEKERDKEEEKEEEEEEEEEGNEEEEIEIVAQIGIPEIDHKYWGRADDMDRGSRPNDPTSAYWKTCRIFPPAKEDFLQTNGKKCKWIGPEPTSYSGSLPFRPVFKLSKDNPGADIASMTASALASASLIFHNDTNIDYLTIEDDYSERLLKLAEKCIKFATKYKGNYILDGKIPAFGYYGNGLISYHNYVAHGNIWMFLASGKVSYLLEAINYDDQNTHYETYHWRSMTWANKVLLASIFSKDKNKYNRLFPNDENDDIIFPSMFGDEKSDSKSENFNIMRNKKSNKDLIGTVSNKNENVNINKNESENKNKSVSKNEYKRNSNKFSSFYYHSQYSKEFEAYMESWIEGPRQPSGIVWSNTNYWGSNRHAANQAFLSLIYYTQGGGEHRHFNNKKKNTNEGEETVSKDIYLNFARQQIDLLLGILPLGDEREKNSNMTMNTKTQIESERKQDGNSVGLRGVSTSSTTANIQDKYGKSPGDGKEKKEGEEDEAVDTNINANTFPNRNLHSWVIGYGRGAPYNPHHASSSCFYDVNTEGKDITCSWDWYGYNYELDDGSIYSMFHPNGMILHGALVGGPYSCEGDYHDVRPDFKGNEVALDYNAGFQAALGALSSIDLKLYPPSPTSTSTSKPSSSTSLLSTARTNFSHFQNQKCGPVNCSSPEDLGSEYREINGWPPKYCNYNNFIFDECNCLISYHKKCSYLYTGNMICPALVDSEYYGSRENYPGTCSCKRNWTGRYCDVKKGEYGKETEKEKATCSYNEKYRCPLPQNTSYSYIFSAYSNSTRTDLSHYANGDHVLRKCSNGKKVNGKSYYIDYCLLSSGFTEPGELITFEPSSAVWLSSVYGDPCDVCGDKCIDQYNNTAGVCVQNGKCKHTSDGN